MGLSTGNHTSKTYLQIVAGRVAQKSAEGVHGAVSRENKKKEIVWELHHDSISGKIKEMNIEAKTFASGKTKQLEIVIQDADESFILTLPVESKYFDHFCSKIGSANLNKEIIVKPYSFVPKDKPNKISGLNLYQKEKETDSEPKKLGYYFSPENPEGKPFPPEERMDEDEYKMFKIKERKFYCEYILGMTKLKPAAADVKSTLEPAPDDDLPF